MNSRRFDVQLLTKSICVPAWMVLLLQVVFAWQEDGMVFPVKTLRLDCMHLAFDMLAATALFRAHLTSAKGETAPKNDTFMSATCRPICMVV